MMMQFSMRWLGVSFAVVGALMSSAVARPTPLATAFTYQGQLKLSGSPVNTTADFQFTLWDALSGGAQVAGPVSINNMAVANGLFTTSIDFGSNVFDGNARWLEIAVRSPAGSGAFTTLSPRQPLTVAPYALQTRGIFVDNNDKVGVGTSAPQTRFQVADDLYVDSTLSFVGVNRSNRIGAEYFGIRAPVGDNTYGGMYISTDGGGGWPFYGYAAGGNADMWTYYDGATDKWHLYNGGIRLTVDGVGNVGIGTSSPAYPLHITSTGEYVLSATNTSTTSFSSAGYFQCSGNFSKCVHAYAAATSGSNYGVLAQNESSSGIGVAGFILASDGTNYGVVGHTNSASGYDFYADGAGIHYGSPSSIRWKRNVELIDQPLQMLSQMRGVYFDWDQEHGGHHDVGMIGEEVGKVLPEIVAYEADSQYVTGMDYSKLTPLLVEAVKSLRAEKDSQIQQQHEQITSLQLDNQQLHDRLTALEAAMARLSNQQEKH